MKKIPFYRRLRFKFILAYSLIILLGSVTTAYFVINIVDTDFRKLLLKQFNTTIQTTENFIDFLGQTSLSTANHLTTNDDLLSLVTKDRREEMVDHVVYLMESISADTIVLLDRDGTVLVRGHDPENYGDTLKSISIVRKALVEKVPSTSIVQELQNFMVFSSGIIYGEDSKEVRGVILVGHLINDEFVENIKKNVNLDITIVRDRAVMASTLYKGEERISLLPIPYLEYQMLLSNRSKIIERTIIGTESFIVAKNLSSMEKNMSGSILITYPQDELIAIKKNIKRKFILLFVIGFLIILFLEYKLSQKILSPVNELINMTKRISEEELDVNININTKDEFQLLADHFNRMVDSLKKKDRRLKDYYENLEEKVKERTSALKASNDLKELFMDIMSHDLLNPAGVVRTSSEILFEEENEPHKERFLGLIRDSSSEMIQTIQNLAEYSKLQSTDQLERKTRDLNEVLKKIVSHFDHDIRSKKLKLGDFPTGEFKADLNVTIENVFMNLLSNAIKYSHEGGKIEIDIHGESGNYLVTVKDFGLGVPDKDKMRIFERFKRSETGGNKGSGLGLAIAKRIVDLHGGKIWVEDNPEGGSIFYVRLPKE